MAVSMRKQASAAPPTAMRFLDFAVRAWREGPYLQVIAHSTPAGSMRQPAATRIGVFDARDFRLPVDAPLRDGAALGKRLAKLLMPDEVWRLFGESLQRIGPQPELGLRLRLCLDEDLIDLPWELLYRRDVEASAARSGFLLTDSRISLVREPPAIALGAPPSDRTRSGLFLGTFFDDGSDVWGVQTEYESLSKAMRPLRSLLSFDFAHTDDAAAVERAVASGCDVFHYAGHIDVDGDHVALVQLADSAAFEGANAGVRMEKIRKPAEFASAAALAPRLVRGGTRLAVFNACNSGFWPFARHFVRAGLPALVGVQGLVSNIAALNFAEKLYKSLAVGLTLDEALTYARLYVMGPEHSYYECDWARFMAYMPTEGAPLFPRPERETMRKRQASMRTERIEAAHAVLARARQLDGADVSRVLSDIAQRSVLILGRFTAERKAVLDGIRRALSSPPHSYVPLLFDFDKPGDRDLIESIVRFAAVSRFVIADLSEPKSVPAELQAIVPQFPSLPVIPIIQTDEREYPVSDHIMRRPSVHKPIVNYRDVAHLLTLLDAQVLRPAEALHEALSPPVLASA
jgi:hypothetical protein